MMKPEQFRQIADEALGGLTAGPALLHRARMKAAQAPVQTPARRLHRGLAMAMSLALVLGLSALLLPKPSQPDIPVVETLQAGSDAQAGMRSTADLPRGAVALQLSDVGTVTDHAEVDRLMGILYDKALYLGSQGHSGSQALLVQYASGLVLQLAVSGDTLSACGSWDCPEFIRAFADAVQ